MSETKNPEIGTPETETKNCESESKNLEIAPETEAKNCESESETPETETPEMTPEIETPKIKTKNCRHCNVEYPFDQFRPQPTTADGRSCRCEPCWKQMHANVAARKRPSAPVEGRSNTNNERVFEHKRSDLGLKNRTALDTQVVNAIWEDMKKIDSVWLFRLSHYKYKSVPPIMNLIWEAALEHIDIEKLLLENVRPKLFHAFKKILKKGPFKKKHQMNLIKPGSVEFKKEDEVSEDDEEIVFEEIDESLLVKTPTFNSLWLDGEFNSDFDEFKFDWEDEVTQFREDEIEEYSPMFVFIKNLLKGKPRSLKDDCYLYAARWFACALCGQAHMEKVKRTDFQQWLRKLSKSIKVDWAKISKKTLNMRHVYSAVNYKFKIEKDREANYNAPNPGSEKLFIEAMDRKKKEARIAAKDQKKKEIKP